MKRIEKMLRDEMEKKGINYEDFIAKMADAPSADEFIGVMDKIKVQVAPILTEKILDEKYKNACMAKLIIASLDKIIEQAYKAAFAESPHLAVKNMNRYTHEKEEIKKIREFVQGETMAKIGFLFEDEEDK